MVLSDIPEVLQIERQVFDNPWSRASVLEELTSHHAYLCIQPSLHGESDQTVGYLFYRLIFEEMQLLRIAVDPSRRRRGIANRLLDRGIYSAVQTGAEKILLEVGNLNDNGISFYEQAGFQQIGRRPNYYSRTGEDALILMKYIKQKEAS